MTVHLTKMTLFRQRQYGESDAVVNYPVERLRGKELSEVSSNYLQRTEVLNATILRGQNPARMHAADLEVDSSLVEPPTTALTYTL